MGGKLPRDDYSPPFSWDFIDDKSPAQRAWKRRLISWPNGRQQPPHIHQLRGWNPIQLDETHSLWTTCTGCNCLLNVAHGPTCGNCQVAKRDAARKRRNTRKRQSGKKV